jgi:dihydrodipicolinate synthase/N-acetylneuraminate lyase
LNGAEPLVRTLLASGVNTCFANPGTSEMHFVAVHDRVPGMRKAAPARARAIPTGSYKQMTLPTIAKVYI